MHISDFGQGGQLSSARDGLPLKNIVLAGELPTLMSSVYKSEGEHNNKLAPSCAGLLGVKNPRNRI